jgi:hypothetical protein
MFLDALIAVLELSVDAFLLVSLVNRIRPTGSRHLEQDGQKNKLSRTALKAVGRERIFFITAHPSQ